MKKLALFFILISGLLVFSACSDGNEEREQEQGNEETETTEETETEEQEQKQVVRDKSDTVQNDDEIKENIEKEEGVSSVSVIVTEDGDGMVLVDIEVDGAMEEAEAQELVDKYAQQLEEKYPDYTIDVQARKDGETFVTAE